MFVIPSVEPVAFYLGNIAIYKYGITLAIAIFVAIFTANSIFNRINNGYKKDLMLEYAPLIIIIGILCARLYFCVLNPSYYLSHPLEILDIRQGGLSIHGGLIGGIAAILVAAKISKCPSMLILDSLACAAFLGQAIGRWGNYFNSEAYGLPVAGQNWGLFIPKICRLEQFYDIKLYHPAFLYESLLDFGGFILLLWLINKFGKKYIGLVFYSYLMLYSIIRLIVEQIRVDSVLNIGNIHIAVIVSLILFRLHNLALHQF